jgi:hypothetical protein
MSENGRRRFAAQRSDNAFGSYALVAIAALAAWFPICRSYLRMADDFHFADWLMNGGVRAYFHDYGVWRIFGHQVAAWSVFASPLLPGVLALLTHCAASLLLLAAARRLFVSGWLALCVALVFAAFPWGATALMWASAYTYALSTALFLAVICLLLAVFPIGDFVTIAGCVACSALSLFANESLFFAMMISGGLALLRRDRGDLIKNLPVAAAPAIGGCIWFGLYKIFPGSLPQEHPKLNPRTVLSGLYYQYTNLWVFEPWRNQSARGLLFFDWSWVQFAVGFSAIAAVGFTLIKLRPASDARRGAEASRADRRVLLFLFLLLTASVAIYAIGGGFSLDSRKKYPIVAIGLLFTGCCLDQFPQVFAFGPRTWKTAVIAALGVGIATSWLQIGLWRYDARRLDLLVNFLSTQPDPDRVQVQWDSRVQAAWPHANQYWGAPVEAWVLADAVAWKRTVAPGKQVAPPARAVVFDPVSFTWEAVDAPKS